MSTSLLPIVGGTILTVIYSSKLIFGTVTNVLLEGIVTVQRLVVWTAFTVIGVKPPPPIVESNFLPPGVWSSRPSTII